MASRSGGHAVLAPRSPKIGTGDLGIWPRLVLLRAGVACGWLAGRWPLAAGRWPLVLAVCPRWPLDGFPSRRSSICPSPPALSWPFGASGVLLSPPPRQEPMLLSAVDGRRPSRGIPTQGRT